MESAVRYDFSFPPKSNNGNLNPVMQTTNGTCPINSHSYVHPNLYMRPQQMQENSFNSNNLSTTNNNPNSIGLSRSASTSPLNCTSNINRNNVYNKLNNNYCNSCNNCKENVANGKINNNNTLQNNMNLNKNCMISKNAHFNVHPKPTSLALLQNQNVINQISHAPATPKDSNCSFTFDDLKNTLAFMEDSPLVSSHNNNNNNGNLNIVSQNNSNVLMVIPNATSSDCPSSVLSLSSSSSSVSSSCGSCYNTYLPKSNSNPMLLSAGSSSSSASSSSSNNALSTSPSSTSSLQNKKPSECECSNSTSISNLTTIHQYQTPNSNSVLDLFIKKSNQETIENSSSFEQYSQNSGSLITTANNMSSLLTNVTQSQNNSGYNAIETAAKKYRCAAQISEATCCWKGKLPPKQYKTPIVYSTKVFVGGLPWDITEDDLIKEFGVFGSCRVEWTNKEKFNIMGSNLQIQQNDMPFDQNSNQNSINSYNPMRNTRSMSNFQNQKQQNLQQNLPNSNVGNNDPFNSSKHRLSPGFAYVIYDSEYSVRSLVGNCIEDYQNGRDRVEYYFKISTRRVRNKEVQIIPWILADNNFALCQPKDLDPKKTVFVGNLHGTMTARDLAHIMNELFGCVVYAGIDIDKLKYPIGSGRVTFSHQQNFMRAVRAAFVDIQSSKFSKRIQIDPYLEDVQCCLCYSDKGVYFCRDFQCFNYYCGLCWDKQHSYNQLGNHKPLMRKREDKI